MDSRTLYDIAQVCTKYDITSRTLRFYEQKGIIHSTRTGSSMRRQYSEEQMRQIHSVIVLRRLGLSVRTIAELQQTDTNLKTALIRKRAEIGAAIDTKLQEVSLLNQALVLLDENKNVFTENFAPTPVQMTPRVRKILEECGNSIVSGNHEPLYQHLSGTMQEYMPVSAFIKLREDTLLPLGNFVCHEKTEPDQTQPGTYHQFFRYDYFGLKVRYVFIEEKIHGLWLGYYKI